MNKQITTVPALRFPEFVNAGEWAGFLFGDIASFSKGKGISKSDIVEHGALPCIRYGELYTLYGETIEKVVSTTNISPDNLVLSKCNDVIMPASGETQEDIATASCVKKNGIALGGDLNIIRSSNDGVFISYYLNSSKKQDISQISQGISVVHLYSSQLKTLNMRLPKIKEQQKIANCLTALDELITAHTDKLQALKDHKKGLMQNLFPAEGKTTPNYRFPEFVNAGGWQEKKLEDVGNFKSGTGFTETEQGGKSGMPFFKVSDMNLEDNQKIMVSANNYVNDEQIALLNYKPISKKSIIFAKVGAAIFLERKRIANNFLIDNNMMAFTPTGDIDFVRQWFDTIKLSRYAKVGALPSYSASDLKIININLPSKQEQQKIANCLTALDDLITAQNEKITQLQQHKKGLMQNLFPTGK